MSFELWPCKGGPHDFAVGVTTAICNRCEKVVPLEVGRCGHSIEPAQPGVGELSCDWPAGHQGEHGNRDGASWTQDGQYWQAG